MQSLSLLLEKASQGDSNSQLELGLIYEQGQNTPQNYAEAAKWYEKASDQGNAVAQYHLGMLYLYGNGVSQNYNDAAKYLIRSANQENADAQYYLGMMYDKGCCGFQNKDEAIKWYVKSAKQGNMKAKAILNSIAEEKKIAEQIALEKKSKETNITTIKEKTPEEEYKEGIAALNEKPKKYNTALKCFKKAAESNHAEAIYYLGLMYERGWGVYQNDQEAVKWYAKAIDLGFLDAHHALIQLKNKISSEKLYISKHTETMHSNLHTKSSSTVQSNLIMEKDGESECKAGIAFLNEKPKKFSNALKCFRKAAEENHPDALYYLGLMYERGWGVNQSDQEAINWYYKAAKLGHYTAKQELLKLNKNNDFKQGIINSPSTETYLGQKYLKGDGVPQSYSEAFNHFKIAAERNYAPAQYYLATLYCKGLGTQVSYSRAAEWFLKSAEQGNVDAQYELACLYEKIKPLNKNEDSIFWYKKAANNGNINAYYGLGKAYYKGINTPIDYTEAAKWLMQPSKIGILDAEYFLGTLYEFGNGVTQDYTKALELYTKGAERRNANSIHKLALMYANGIGVAINLSKAVRLLKQAIEIGHIKAHYDLAMLYFTGKVNVDDKHYILDLLERAAKQGDHISQYKLGTILFEGLPLGNGLTLYKYSEALDWLSKAATNGYADAQFYLGTLLFQSKHVIRDVPDAIKNLINAFEQNNTNAINYLNNIIKPPNMNIENSQSLESILRACENAAKKGDAKSQFFIGVLYYIGKLLPKSYAEAYHWFQKASNQNYTEAIYQLGIMHYFGEGVPKDFNEAYYYFEKAAFLNHCEANYMIGKILFEYKHDVLCALQFLSNAANRLNHMPSKELLDDIMKSNEYRATIRNWSERAAMQAFLSNFE